LEFYDRLNYLVEFCNSIYH